MSNQYFGAFGPGPNSDYLPHPLAETLEFLEREAFNARCESDASRAPHNRARHSKAADAFERHAASVLAVAYPAHLAPAEFVTLGALRRRALAWATGPRLASDSEADAIRAENDFLSLCEALAPAAFGPGSRFESFALKATAVERIEGAAALIAGRRYPGLA